MNRGRQLLFIFGVAAAAVGLYVAVRFFSQSEESRIQRAVYAAVAGVEQDDPKRYGRILRRCCQRERRAHRSGLHCH